MAREAELKKQRVFNTGNGVAKPVWNNANRVNRANHFVPRPVQLNVVRSNVNTGRTNVNFVRHNVNSVRTNVNTGRSKQPVPTNHINSFGPVRPQLNKFNQRSHFSKSHSLVKRPIVRNTARMTYSHAVKGNWATATQFDLKPHMQSQSWTDINAGIQQHLQKLYNTNKASLKVAAFAKYLQWQEGCSQGKMESSATREYPSLIHTFFLTHTVGGEFLNPEDKALYDEMLRLQRLGSNTSMGVPYTEDEIMVIVRYDKQQGHIPSVGRVLPGQGMVILPPPLCTHSFDVAKIKKSEKRLTKQVKMFIKLFRSDDKFSQMLTQLESRPEYGGGSGSGGCRDDELGDDEDDDEDEEDG
ncbi:hypothetical protein Tco_0509217 [Tanacetum coccineum]